MRKNLLFLCVTLTVLFFVSSVLSPLHHFNSGNIDNVENIDVHVSEVDGGKNAGDVTRGTLHPFNPSQWNPDWILINGRYYDRQPRRDTQFTNGWYYQDAINNGGRLMTYNEARDWMQTWGCQNIGGSADIVYDHGGFQDLYYTDQPCCSCNYPVNWGSPVHTGNNGGAVYGWDTLYATCIMTENAAISEAGDQEMVCYAQYKSYTLRVEVNTIDNLADAEEVKVYMDYNNTNATFCYNWLNQTFYKLQDVPGHLDLLVNNCSISNDNDEYWFLDFTFNVDFSFPHEELVDCFIDVTATNGDDSRDFFSYLFRVENDIEFVGTPELEAEYQGDLAHGDWIRGNEYLTLSNLTVYYQDSLLHQPSDEYFDVMVIDSNGGKWWDNESSGEQIGIEWPSHISTDVDEVYTITIENLLAGSVAINNFTFPVKIDADAPPPPSSVVCHADNFNDRECMFTDQTEMYVTWELVSDNGSGLKGYYYSSEDGSESLNGTYIEETEVYIDRLHEGFASVYVWCEDQVGNIGVSSTSGIFVDLTGPRFNPLYPDDGGWHNDSTVSCAVEVTDSNGSGVDPTSIFYSTSSEGIHAFTSWIPVWVTGSGEKLTATINHKFQEGTENYIKWRARDISENGFEESAPVNIKVDSSPVEFEDELVPSRSWFDRTEVTSTIAVHEIGKSGFDYSTFRVRFSTNGVDDFGPWFEVPEENITELENNKCEMMVSYNYGTGTNNYIQFKGTDIANNPFTHSEKFNIAIDDEPVFFDNFVLEDIDDPPEVSCSIYILDDHSGVDLTSIKYSISTEGDEESEYSSWTSVDPRGIFPGDPVRVDCKVVLDWGRDNYLRFKADDVVGTGSSLSGTYRINVTSIPDVQISQPSKDSLEFGSDEIILFDAKGTLDLDGDLLTFYWRSNICGVLGYNESISTSLPPGNHTITLFVEDPDGNNESEDIRVNVREITGGGDNGGAGGAGGDGGDSSVASSAYGGLDMWWLVVIVVTASCLLLALCVFLVMRRKRNKVSEQPTPSIPSNSNYPLQPTPYSSNPVFTPQARYNVNLPPRAALPLSTSHSPISQFAPPGAGQRPPAQPLALPPASPTSSLGPYPAPGTLPPSLPAGPSTPLPNYSLPTFSVEGKEQDLNRLALPPAPEGMSVPSPSPPPSTPSSPSAFQPPAVPPVSPPSVVAELPPTPPPSVQAPGPLSGDASLSAPPSTSASSLALACHSCGGDYVAEIETYPATVTCPHCNVQGIIDQ